MGNDKIGEGVLKVQTSTYKMIKSEGCKVQHRKYSQYHMVTDAHYAYYSDHVINVYKCQITILYT